MVRIPLPSRAMAVALLAIFLNLAGIGYAATGGNFILGKANSATSTTALTGTPASGAALSVVNGTSGLPAAAFKVTGTAAPFTVGSPTKVTNLNADLLDGLSSASFEPSANVVQVNAIQFPLNTNQRFDLGPNFSLGANCSSSGGTDTLDEVVYNHAGGTMTATASELLGQTPKTKNFSVSSGGSTTVESLSTASTANNHVTVIARVNGEIDTAVFAAFVASSGCEILGTLTRAS